MGGSAYWQLLVSGGKSGHQATATGTAPTTAMPTKSHIPPTDARVPRPGDATLSVTKAARVLGVHPNTVRAWSEAGRLRYYRINDRGDRRYRLGDLQRFLAAAASDAPAALADAGDGHAHAATGHRADGPHAHRVRGRPRPAGGPRRGRLVPGRARPGARRGLPPHPRSRPARRWSGSGSAGRAGSSRARRDVEGPGITAGRTVRARAAACSRRRSSPAEPIHARPGDAGPGPGPRHGHRRAHRAHPGRRGSRGASSSSRARCSSGPTTAAGSPGAIARTLGRPRPRRQRDRAGDAPACAAPRRCAGSRPTSPRGSTSATSSATSPTTPGSCSAPTGSPWSCTTPRAASARPAAPASRTAFLAVAAGPRERPPRRSASIPPRRPVVLVGPDAPRSAQPDPRRRRPGGRRHAARARRSSTATSSTGSLYLAHDRAAPLARGRPRRRGGPRRRRGHRRALRADVRPDGRLGGPAPVDPAPRRAAVGPHRGARRSATRSRPSCGSSSTTTTPASTGSGDEASCRSRCRATGAVYSRRDRRGARRRRSARASPAGSPGSASRSSSTTRPTTRARSRSPAPSPTSTSRCSSRRWSTRACASASSSCRKLGLRQFTEDDLRLLVIYASFAAQAMANADATARMREQSDALERQLRAQRELLRIDRVDPDHARPARGAGADHRPARVAHPVRQHRDRGRRARRPGCCVPLTARGVHADDYLAAVGAGRDRHRDLGRGAQRARPDRGRAHGRAGQPLPGHGRDRRQPDRRAAARPARRRRRPDARAAGHARPVHEQEFELVQLFAAQVSIALRNAEIFQAAEERARTDDLTGLLNHGTFKDWLGRSVAAARARSAS